MLTAIGFMLINCACYFLSLRRGPIWGLIAYVNIYFNPPNPLINWWASYLPFSRWSLLTSAVLILSVFIHWKNTSDHKLASAKWAFAFCLLSLLVTMMFAVDESNAYKSQYLLFSYCLIIFIIVKTIAEEKQLRWFLLASVVLSAHQSLNAYLYGQRVHARLEGIGSSDAFGSNEFALLLAGVFPFLVVFLRNGGVYERLICFISLPFILNAFILCNSRGATVAFVLALFISALIVGDKKVRRGILIMTLMTAPIFYYLADDAYKERFSTLLGAKEAYQTEEEFDRLSSGRIAIWNYGLEMAADHPFGIGPDGFSEMAHVYMPRELLKFEPGDEHGRRAAHSTYLQVLVEQGVIGLGLWLLMCLSICLTLKKYFKLISQVKNISPFWRDTVFALTVSFLTTLAGGLVTSRVYYEYFWWQIALVVVVISMVKKIVEQDSSPDQAQA